MQADPPKQVLGQAIATELEEQILLGGIAAGSRLDEMALAHRFGVSRTPVREALHIVVSRGMARRLPYRGVIVAEISPERIDQLFEAMAEIEALCGRFAADRMTPQERVALVGQHDLLSRLAETGGAQAYEQANTRFHQMIYAGSHNEDLAAMAEVMRLKLAPFRRSQLAGLARIDGSNAEHARIVSALVGRDGPAAETALRRHLRSAAQTMLDKWRLTRSDGPPPRRKAI